MTQQAQQVVKKPVPIDPVFINTPTGTVAVFGHEYVSKNMLQMLGTALIHDAFETIYHGVKSVVFRIDGYPKSDGRSVCATFAPDTGGICINMEKTLEQSMERSMDHPSTSLMASWWIEMLLNFGHEIHHAVRWNTNRDELASSEEKRAEEEERAEKYTDTLLIDLVKEYDIEPPAINSEPWFNTQIMELLENKEETDKWASDQKDMLDNGYIWKHVPKDKAKETIILHTFKDLICLISGGEIESEEWNKTVIKLPDGVKTLDEQLNGRKVIIDSSPASETIQEPLQAVYTNKNYDMYQDPAPTPVAPVNTPTIPLTTNMAYTGIQHDMATINRIAKQVYMKMYDFIFKNCGQLKDSDIGFSNPEAVCTITLPLTAEESSIFVSMNHLDINGRWCTDVPTTNGLFGKVMKNTKLPSYEVNLNVNGVIHKRLFMPQNPAKRNAAGQLTQRAIEARAGNAIAYVMNPEDDTVNKWGPSITNGEYKIPQAR